MATLVLVHGAFHGPWCFEPVIPALVEAGHHVVAPELPLRSLLGDAALVTETLDELSGTEPVVLVGHSYGGAVVTVAGTHPLVDRLVYLAAMAPDAGEGPAGCPVEVGEAFIAALRPTPDGLLEVDPAQAAAAFYPDADPATAAAWAVRLRPGRAGLPEETVPAAAWRTTPADYVVCADDPILLPASQRALAARTGATLHELPGDHSPFLARPAALIDLLLAAADAAAAGR